MKFFGLALTDLNQEPLSVYKMLSFFASQERPLLSPVHQETHDNCIDFQILFQFLSILLQAP